MGNAESFAEADTRPLDLLIAQTAFLSYPETLQFCQLHPRIQGACDSGELWRFKIEREFDLTAEQYLPTITPIDRKYLEVKSVLGVDFGSEYYLEDEQFIRRATQPRNFRSRDEMEKLLRYFLALRPNIKTRRVLTSVRVGQYVIDIFVNLLAAGEDDLADRIIAESRSLADFKLSNGYYSAVIRAAARRGTSPPPTELASWPAFQPVKSMSSCCPN